MIKLKRDLYSELNVGLLNLGYYIKTLLQLTRKFRKEIVFWQGEKKC